MLVQASQVERKTVAEAIAFAVAAHQELDTSSYIFPYYIAGLVDFQDGQVLIKAVMGRVQTIAHTIIDGLEAHEEETSPPAAAAISKPTLRVA